MQTTTPHTPPTRDSRAWMAWMTALALAATGCGVESTAPAAGAIAGGDELAQTLRAVQPPPVVFGCADVEVVAANTAGSRALIVRVSDGLAEEAAATQQTVAATWTLPHPDVEVYAQWGTDVTQPLCNDAIEPGVVVDGEAEAISGTLTLEVVPDGIYQPWDHSGDATVTLEDVVLEDPTTGSQRTLGRLDLVDVGVGWYPG